MNVLVVVVFCDPLTLPVLCANVVDTTEISIFSLFFHSFAKKSNCSSEGGFLLQMRRQNEQLEELHEEPNIPEQCQCWRNEKANSACCILRTAERFQERPVRCTIKPNILHLH
jgi:hypothetical protein